MSDLFRSVLNGSGGDALVGSTVEAGQFRLQIQKKVAEGGFACIYIATNEENNQLRLVFCILTKTFQQLKQF